MRSSSHTKLSEVTSTALTVEQGEMLLAVLSDFSYKNREIIISTILRVTPGTIPDVIINFETEPNSILKKQITKACDQHIRRKFTNLKYNPICVVYNKSNKMSEAGLDQLILNIHDILQIKTRLVTMSYEEKHKYANEKMCSIIFTEENKTKLGLDPNKNYHEVFANALKVYNSSCHEITEIAKSCELIFNEFERQSHKISHLNESVVKRIKYVNLTARSQYIPNLEPDLEASISKMTSIHLDMVNLVKRAEAFSIQLENLKIKNALLKNFVITCRKLYSSISSQDVRLYIGVLIDFEEIDIKQYDKLLGHIDEMIYKLQSNWFVSIVFLTNLDEMIKQAKAEVSLLPKPPVIINDKSSSVSQSSDDDVSFKKAGCNEDAISQTPSYDNGQSEININETAEIKKSAKEKLEKENNKLTLHKNRHPVHANSPLIIFPTTVNKKCISITKNETTISRKMIHFGNTKNLYFCDINLNQIDKEHYGEFIKIANEKIADGQFLPRNSQGSNGVKVYDNIISIKFNAKHHLGGLRLICVMHDIQNRSDKSKVCIPECVVTHDRYLSLLKGDEKQATFADNARLNLIITDPNINDSVKKHNELSF